MTRKLEVRATLLPASGQTGLALFDSDTGMMLAGQTSVSSVNVADGIGRITVEFMVDGRGVKMVPSKHPDDVWEQLDAYFDLPAGSVKKLARRFGLPTFARGGSFTVGDRKA